MPSAGLGILLSLLGADVRATSLETLRYMVVAGLGVTLMPELAVESPFGSQRGLGYLLMTAIGLQNIQVIMSVTLLLVIVAATVNGLLLAQDRRLRNPGGR